MSNLSQIYVIASYYSNKYQSEQKQDIKYIFFLGAFS